MLILEVSEESKTSKLRPAPAKSHFKFRLEWFHGMVDKKRPEALPRAELIAKSFHSLYSGHCDEFKKSPIFLFSNSFW